MDLADPTAPSREPSHESIEGETARHAVPAGPRLEQPGPRRLRWVTAALPHDETQRLAALRRYAVLDTPLEPEYDDLAALASTLCATPIALISLVDADRQWFKAKVGIGAEQTPREMAFCAHALLDPAHVFEVADATLDDRFADNPLVTGAPDVRFYAGAPLITPDRQVLGTLCVIDRIPRSLAPIEKASLQALARQVVAQLELRRAALTDGLTGLANRNALRAALSKAAQRAGRRRDHRCAVLFMDFDRFKWVNDRFGHRVGDELLRQIAQRLQRELASHHPAGGDGEDGRLAARIGGDEFVVLLDGLRQPEDAMSMAQRLLDALSEPYAIGGHTIHSTASVGVAISAPAPADGSLRPDVADGLLGDADTAMYEAKRAGRGRCVLYVAGMHESVTQRAGLEADLRLAVEHQRLSVAYQPIVELAGGRVSGVEALARWEHPQRGNVPPLDFIPIAEDTGLIGPLGAWVLDAACRQFMAWRRSLRAAAPQSVSVNLSRAQIQLPGFLPMLSEVLSATAIPPACLQLEVTESLAAQDETIQATLRAVQALGVRLALDDFGTGYSSLACLGELPVDTVKIDRSFVGQSEHSQHHRVLIQATLAVTRSLQLTTVAEGVETAAQAALLKALGCGFAQGYFFSRPLAAPACTNWLQARHQALGAVPSASSASSASSAPDRTPVA